MSLSTVRPIACRVPSSTESNGSDPKTSKVTMFSRKSLPLLQMKEEKKPTTSRREMMHFTAASIGLASLVLPLNAEASPFMEKLGELMQNFGLSSKPKTDEPVEKKPKEEENKDKKPKAEDNVKKNLDLKTETEEKKPKPEEKDVKLEIKKEAEEKKPKPEDKEMKLETKNEAEEKKPKEVDKVVKLEPKTEADEKKPKEGDLKEKQPVAKIEAEENKPKEDKPKEEDLKDKKPVAKIGAEVKKPSLKQR